MKFTCSRCGEIFVKPHPAMLIVTGKRILFFAPFGVEITLISGVIKTDVVE
jgi:hypothetical protein